MRTFYFNTGVKPYNTNVEMQIEAGNEFVNGELHMPFQVSDDVPENARLFCLSNNARELYGNDSDFIVTEVLGGNLHSKYAVFHRPLKEEPKQEWAPTQGETVWIKVFSNWSKGTYIGYDVVKQIHIVREEEKGGENLFSSTEVLPYYAMPNEPKQETLEEAAEKYADYSNEHVTLSCLGDKFNEGTKISFMEGAKWQAERMYSEEEVFELLCSIPNFFNMTIPQQSKARREWFEQFKKK